MKVFEAKYNDCIHESSAFTISIHYTKKGAEKAIRECIRKHWHSLKSVYKTKKEFMEDREAFVVETEIQK